MRWFPTPNVAKIQFFSQIVWKMWSRPSKYVKSAGSIIWTLLRNIVENENFVRGGFFPLGNQDAKSIAKNVEDPGNR